MFNCNKIKALESANNAFEARVQALERGISEKNRQIESLEFQLITGIYSSSLSIRIALLGEARNRGFFDYNNIIIPLGKNAPVRHCPSTILSNYMYFEDTQRLRIPAIGYGDHIFSGTVEIYHNGVWAEVKPISKRKIDDDTNN